jgi:hypothetical protein
MLNDEIEKKAITQQIIIKRIRMEIKIKNKSKGINKIYIGRLN